MQALPLGVHTPPKRNYHLFCGIVVMMFRWRVYPIFNGVPSTEPFFAYMNYIPADGTIDPQAVAERLGAEIVEDEG